MHAPIQQANYTDPWMQVFNLSALSDNTQK